MRRIYDKARSSEAREFLTSGEESPINASPFVWVDPAAIPRRRWLYGRHYVRSFISETVAPGAYGKSTLVMTEALAIVTGCPLLGVTADEQANVWYWNGEDPMEELQRRIVAACLHYQIDRSEIEGRLFVDTGRNTKIIIADQTKTGARVARPIVDQVIETIRDNEIGLVIVDPFVASHRVVENDNPAIELVAGVWAEIADLTGCAIELVHHARKTGGAEITVDDGRGASALLAKARSARTLNAMSEDEAVRAGVAPRRSFFRVQNGKSNLAPAADQADWYRLVSIDLANADSVGVVARWTWPNPLDGVTGSDLRKVHAAIADGRWRKDSQAKDWVGHVIAAVLKLDVNNKAHRAKIVALLQTCSRHGSRPARLSSSRVWTPSAKGALSLKREPQPMTDFAAPRSCSFAVPRRTPHPYKGVGAATGVPHLPHLAAPHLIKCGRRPDGALTGGVDGRTEAVIWGRIEADQLCQRPQRAVE